MSNVKIVPHGEVFESSQTSSVTDRDYKDIFKSFPDDSRIVRKHLCFKDMEDGEDLLIECTSGLEILFDKIGASEEPAVVITINRPEHKPELSLDIVAEAMDSIETIYHTSVLWSMAVNREKYYSIDLLVEVGQKEK